MARRQILVLTLAAACGVVLTTPAWPQTGGATAALVAPDYGSGATAGALSNSNYNTPEADGRPGVMFFAYGVAAFKKGDYQHAVDMYKVAASWAYKPAEYNLGVMYFKGQGVPVNRPLGAAWMVLAAERGNAEFVKARDLMVTVLTPAQFQQTDELWGELRGTYGDKVALRRAKAQWARVKSEQTGSRVGSQAVNLQIGALDQGHSPQSGSIATTGFALMQGGSVDGSVAYREFQQSADPYGPLFLGKNRTGKATIGPLQVLDEQDAAPPAKAARPGSPPAASSGQPQDHS